MTKKNATLNSTFWQIFCLFCIDLVSKARYKLSQSAISTVCSLELGQRQLCLFARHVRIDQTRGGWGWLGARFDLAKCRSANVEGICSWRSGNEALPLGLFYSFLRADGKRQSGLMPKNDSQTPPQKARVDRLRDGKRNVFISSFRLSV